MLFSKTSFSVAMAVVVAGCASTTTSQLNPSPPEPVCAASATALILWRPQWRVDQKDASAREAAATDGLDQFVKTSGCFRSTSLQRLPQTSPDTARGIAIEATTRYEKVVVVTVRELGPTVKLGASLALIEGGTETVLEIADFAPGKPSPRTFSVHWRSAGPGVIKGVSSLPKDTQAALTAGLQPTLH